MKAGTHQSGLLQIGKGGDTASLSPELSHCTLRPQLTPLPLPSFGLPKAPPARASLLPLPLPVDVTAFFRYSADRGGCRLRV